MKRSLLLLLSVVLLAACTKDFNETPALTAEQEAAYAKIHRAPLMTDKGVLVVQVSEETAAQIEANVTRSGDQTRSGVESIDTRLNEIDASRFGRIFPSDPVYADRERAFGLHRWYYLLFDEETDLMIAARTLSLAEDVEHVNFSYTVRYDAENARVIPASEATRAEGLPFNDPMLVNQWHYNNDGTIPNRAKAGADVNLFEAWDLCTGKTTSGQNIVVAVIDQPVQYSHPDLKANMWINPRANEVDAGLKHGANLDYAGSRDDYKDPTSLTPSPLNWSFDPDEGFLDHGTHVAGTIAAVNNNGIGVAGIAGGDGPEGGNVKIMSCQTANPDNDRNNSLFASARALTWAANHGASVANCSWGYNRDANANWSGMENENDFTGQVPYTAAAIDYFVKYGGANSAEGAGSPLKGGLIFFSAGNTGDKYGDGRTMWPAAYRPVLAVAASGPSGQPSFFTDFGTWCDIVAPGGDELFSKAGSTIDFSFRYDQSVDAGNGTILSTVLDPATANENDEGFIVDRISNYREGGYGWMQGTSMASPHMAGVAALGLAHAANLGKTFTVDEYKALILASTTAAEETLSDANSRYRKMLGAGHIDALKLLSNISGFPVVTIPVTEERGHKVDFSGVLGGIAPNATETTVTISEEGAKRLNLRGSSELKSGKWEIIYCKNPGTAMATIKAVVGGAEISQQVLLVARVHNTENGGWM